MKPDISNLSRWDLTRLKNGVDVLKLTALGLEDSEIAPMLFISPGAVKSRLKTLYRTIGARNRSHAIALMFTDGWLTVEDLRASGKTRQILRRPRKTREAQDD